MPVTVRRLKLFIRLLPGVSTSVSGTVNTTNAASVNACGLGGYFNQFHQPHWRSFPHASDTKREPDREDELDA